MSKCIVTEGWATFSSKRYFTPVDSDAVRAYDFDLQRGSFRSRVMVEIMPASEEVVVRLDLNTSWHCLD